MTLTSTSFFSGLSFLGFHLDRSSILALRKDSGVLRTVFPKQLVGDTHGFLLPFAKLDFEDKTGVEASVVEKGLVVVRDVVSSVVLPNGLRAVRALDWDICTWGGFC